MSLFERLVIGVDIQSYSSRSTREQVVLQRELDRILHEAAGDAGLSRESWECQPEGDGEVAALPGDVNLLAMVRHFVDRLDIRLTDHNEDHTPATRMRLRVAMHIDVMTRGALGSAGPAHIVLKRLLDSAPVRNALIEMPGANLAQIISDALFRKAVMPGLDGVRPSQFREVKVDLPAKNFRETAYLYIPGHHSIPPRTKEPFFPLSLVRSPPRPREQPQPEAPERELPSPAPDPRELDPGVRELVREIRKALGEEEIRRADILTTLALLESAGRGRHGWLRAADGDDLPDALLTELDRAWAGCSGGAWGFHAQRDRLTGLGLSGQREFRPLCVRLGWRDEPDEVVPRHAEFARHGDYGKPFYPTLRNPEREQDPEWHDKWSATVMSVHVRLARWEN